jgi:hypothetical protein
MGTFYFFSKVIPTFVTDTNEIDRGYKLTL